MLTIKEIRLKNKATQAYCAKELNMSLRSFKEYENNKEKQKTQKYNYIVEALTKHFEINENKGIISLDYIKERCKTVLQNYEIDYCYLFGSYAKNKASETSDVDLLISTKNSGLTFYEIVERLRNELHKKVDLLDLKQLNNNLELTNEILKTGVKIYG